MATDRNLDLVDELETADFVEHGPFGQETRGPAADRERMQEFLAAFPDFEATVEDVVAGDLTAAAHLEHLARSWIHLSREYGRDIGFHLLSEGERP